MQHTAVSAKAMRVFYKVLALELDTVKSLSANNLAARVAWWERCCNRRFLFVIFFSVLKSRYTEAPKGSLKSEAGIKGSLALCMGFLLFPRFSFFGRVASDEVKTPPAYCRIHCSRDPSIRRSD